MLSLRVRKPSGAAGERRMVLLFLAGLGLLTVATGALIAMVVFVPHQNTRAVNTAQNSRGVNQHTLYTHLLRENLTLNAAEDRLAKAQADMIRQNVGVARETEDHASTVMQHLQSIDAGAVKTQQANLGISFEAGVIDGINRRIQDSTRGILQSSRAVARGNAESNAKNATILADSRAIASHQGGTRALDAAVLAHVKSIQCSPLIHQCGGRPVPAHMADPHAEQPQQPAAPHRRPQADRPRHLVPSGVLPVPTPTGVPTHPPAVHVPPLGISGVPLVGGLETGLAASGLVGGAASVVGVRRRRRLGRGRR